MQTRRDFLKMLPGFLVVPALLDGLARQPLAQAEQDDLLYAAGARLVKGATVLAELQGPALVFDMQVSFQPPTRSGPSSASADAPLIQVLLRRGHGALPLCMNWVHSLTSYRWWPGAGTKIVARAGTRLFLVADSPVPVWGSGLLIGRKA